VSGWVDGESGPVCGCGNPTVVTVVSGGVAVLLCLFHYRDAGLVTRLPADRPDGWPGVSV
jgi:hypothetical protein